MRWARSEYAHQEQKWIHIPIQLVPAKSECAVWDKDKVWVKAVPRGKAGVAMSKSSAESSNDVESIPRRCWSKCPRAVAAVRERYEVIIGAVSRG